MNNFIGISQVKKLDYEIKISRKLFNLLTAGKIPVNLGERWSWVFEKNTIHLYRSWTNHEIFRFKISNQIISEIEYESNPEIVIFNDSNDAKQLLDDFIKILDV